MAFIKGMKAEIAGGKEKSGVHQGDERRNCRRERKKWCSSRG
ncbi:MULTISPECIES: hypothetical protein [Bacillaceae]|nr:MULTISPECIES: hypothetical protein [Bacillaceae]